MTDKEESFKQFAERSQGMQISRDWRGEYIQPKYQQFEGQYQNLPMQIGNPAPTKTAKYELDGIERQLLAEVMTALCRLETPYHLNGSIDARAVVSALQLLVRIAKTEGVTK